MQDQDDKPSDAAGPGGDHEQTAPLSRKEQLKAARQRAYQAAKARAAERRKAAAATPEAMKRKAAQREKAREQRKSLYAKAKERNASKRQAAKDAADTDKERERQLKDEAILAGLQRGDELEPPPSQDQPPVDNNAAKARRHLRLVRDSSGDE